ncbi:CpXC domain-containing protein [Treponema vincentii]|jgi:uncharacterized protein TP_0599|uniref:CpXC domain-containing protein n=1 Tax=Treponema vincentii F0403 TaxID=1125702 RepID=S3LE27_9SPIR|nr:CpXC domain-containing protein [Treponema vincentii]EPF47726.1 hypothetical protein HMPREF1222_00629 [Treponema vincentii F0403]UTC46477.1 hypothetical protein E4N72_07825 [Treponema vincentii]
MQKITCKCDCSFDVEYEKTIDLDVQTAVKEKIKNGSFLSFVCPSCGSKVNIELETEFVWKSKKTTLLFVPEKKRMECLAFCAGAVRIDAENNKKIKTEFLKKGQTPVIGYPELADRIAVLDADLDPEIVEAVKFFLLDNGKNIKGKHIQILFEKLEGDTIEFHLHGLREKEVAVMRVPLSLYRSVETDHKKGKQKEVFKALWLGPYLSYKNIHAEGDDNEPAV